MILSKFIGEDGIVLDGFRARELLTVIKEQSASYWALQNEV